MDESKASLDTRYFFCGILYIKNMVDEKSKHIAEMESLCALWESGVASNTNGTTGH